MYVIIHLLVTVHAIRKGFSDEHHHRHTCTPPAYWFGVIEHDLRASMRDELAELGLRRGSWRILHTLADGPASVEEIEASLPPRGQRRGRTSGGRRGHGFGNGYGYGRGFQQGLARAFFEAKREQFGHPPFSTDEEREAFFAERRREHGVPPFAERRRTSAGRRPSPPPRSTTRSSPGCTLPASSAEGDPGGTTRNAAVSAATMAITATSRARGSLRATTSTVSTRVTAATTTTADRARRFGDRDRDHATPRHGRTGRACSIHPRHFADRDG